MAPKKVKSSLTSKLNLRIFLAAALITGIVLNLLLTIMPIKERYTNHGYWTRFSTLKKTFNDSIYVNKKGQFIPDFIIYSYAGGAFIQGTSPILIIPETPPLGKYLVGLSILIFKNEHVIILFSGILSLFMLYMIGKQFFSKLIALLPPFFLSFEPLFKNQFVFTPLLDIIHLMFLLLAFYFFIKAVNAQKHTLLNFFLANLFLGGFISTKFFGVGAAIIAAWYVSVILSKNKRHFMYLTLTFPISVLFLLSTYIRVLFTNYPLSQFLGIQKWIFLYNKGHMQHPFSVWTLLLFNKWQTWWGSNAILSDTQWNILWPITVVVTFLTIILYIFKKIPHKRGVEAIMAWIIFYLALLSLSDSTVRYFVILLPMLYLISVFGLENLILKYLKNSTKVIKSQVHKVHKEI